MSTYNKLTFKDALDLKKGRGAMVNSLPELVDCITRLCEWLGGEHLAGKEENPLKLSGCISQKALTSGPYTWWFRGAGNNEHDLHSGLFRLDINALNYTTDVDGRIGLDRRLRHEYGRETRHHFNDLDCNVWDRLFEMQHYEMPTRLLDWTSSLMTALYFAINKAHKPDSLEHHPVIWMLNPRILSGVFLGEYAINDYAYLEVNGSDEEIKNWTKIQWGEGNKDKKFGTNNWIHNKLAVTPGHFPVLAGLTNERLLAQQGCFTLQGGNETAPLNLMADQQSAASEPRYLFKILLNKDCIKPIWKQLQIVGVYEQFLFPEKVHIAASICEQRGLKQANR